MKILAIDQSSKLCGWSIIDNGKLIDFGSYVPYGHLKTKEQKAINIDQRIYAVAGWLEGMIDEHSPDTVVLENTQDQKNPSVVISLSKLLGILQYVVHKSKIECIVVSPTTWRSFYGFNKNVDGKRPKRDELKALAIKYLADVYKVEAEEDEAEASLLGMWAANIKL